MCICAMWDREAWHVLWQMDTYHKLIFKMNSFIIELDDLALGSLNGSKLLGSNDPNLEILHIISGSVPVPFKLPVSQCTCHRTWLLHKGISVLALVTLPSVNDFEYFGCYTVPLPRIRHVDKIIWKNQYPSRHSINCSELHRGISSKNTIVIKYSGKIGILLGITLTALICIGFKIQGIQK